MLQKLTARLIATEDVTPTVRNFVFELSDELNFKPGQFVNLSFNIDDKRYFKPYSIASPPQHKRTLELCVKLVEGGRFTPLLFERKVGDEFGIMGPLGLFTLEKADKEKLVFIAAGTGITPFRSMVLDLLENKTDKQITLIFGVRHETEILYEDEFDLLAQNYPNFRFIKVVSKPTDEWEGRTGHVQDNFDMIDTQSSNVYICGLPAMIEGAKEKLINMGMASEDIHFEKYI